MLSRAGLGLGGLTRGGAAAYVFTNAEAAALVARFTTPPTGARALVIDTLVGALKTAGVWSKLDAFYMLAAADSQAARQNWIADQYNLTPVAAPAFVADRGYTGDGSASYLNTGFNPTTAVSPKFVQDSAHTGAWSRTNLANGAGDSFDFGSSNSYIRRSVAVAGQASGRPNTASAQVYAAGAYPGFTTWTRSAAAVWEGYAQGVDGGGGTTASAVPENAALRIGSINAGGFGVNQIAAAHVGSNLTAGEVLATYNALNTYLTAVGAA